MSDLIVIGYDDAQTARSAYEHVQRLQHDYVVELRGWPSSTSIPMARPTSIRRGGSSARRPSPALWGLLFGVLFLVPGMALLGGAIGALFGKLNEELAS